MKIVIAPDSFKESLAADQVAKAIQAGFMEFFPKAEYHLLPIADGGMGMATALGYQFFDKNDEIVSGDGQDLFQTCSMSDINRDKRLDNVITSHNIAALFQKGGNRVW